MTLAEALERASVFLQSKGIEEAPIKDYWLRVFDETYTQLILKLRDRISSEECMVFEKVLLRLANNEPIQYIIGKADFVGNQYFVTPDTLIPREDTYGLITMGSQYLAKFPDSKVLDIGTGTGVIAIELAKKVEQLSIMAIDISVAALEVAKKNADFHHVKIDFLQSDLLSAVPKEKFDLIVSNPPYISEDEISLMDPSVLLYEPKSALFAENNGLNIYQRLADELPNWISDKGMILLEIGFKQGQEVKKLFETSFPRAKVRIHQDLNHLDRYIEVSLIKGEDNENNHLSK